MICPLCQRDIPHKRGEDHHLMPKTFKGKELVYIHRICHRKIHATFTERELKNYYHTIERLLEDETIQTFVKWVANKDPDFYVSTRETKTRKGKRRR